jgi:hypothetical protein
MNTVVDRFTVALATAGGEIVNLARTNSWH